jgi:hypothetical protein
MFLPFIQTDGRYGRAAEPDAADAEDGPTGQDDEAGHERHGRRQGRAAQGLPGPLLIDRGSSDGERGGSRLLKQTLLPAAPRAPPAGGVPGPGGTCTHWGPGRAHLGPCTAVRFCVR